MLNPLAMDGVQFARLFADALVQPLFDDPKSPNLVGCIFQRVGSKRGQPGGKACLLFNSIQQVVAHVETNSKNLSAVAATPNNSSFPAVSQTIRMVKMQITATNGVSGNVKTQNTINALRSSKSSIGGNPSPCGPAIISH
jgi:hypothetical protein